MNLQGKVLQIQADGDWKSEKYGLMYKYELSIDTKDGQKHGQYMSKKYKSMEELPFKDGDNIYFDFVDDKYPKIKNPSKNDPQQYQESSNHVVGQTIPDDRQRMIVRQSCLTRAVEVVIHENNNAEIVNSGDTLDKIKSIAGELEKWVMR